MRWTRRAELRIARVSDRNTSVARLRPGALVLGGFRVGGSGGFDLAGEGHLDVDAGLAEDFGERGVRRRCGSACGCGVCSEKVGVWGIGANHAVPIGADQVERFVQDFIRNDGAAEGRKQVPLA